METLYSMEIGQVNTISGNVEHQVSSVEHDGYLYTVMFVSDGYGPNDWLYYFIKCNVLGGEFTSKLIMDTAEVSDLYGVGIHSGELCFFTRNSYVKCDLDGNLISNSPTPEKIYSAFNVGEKVYALYPNNYNPGGDRQLMLFDGENSTVLLEDSSAIAGAVAGMSSDGTLTVYTNATTYVTRHSLKKYQGSLSGVHLVDASEEVYLGMELAYVAEGYLLYRVGDSNTGMAFCITDGIPAHEFKDKKLVSYENTIPILDFVPSQTSRNFIVKDGYLYTFFGYLNKFTTVNLSTGEINNQQLWSNYVLANSNFIVNPNGSVVSIGTYFNGYVSYNSFSPIGIRIGGVIEDNYSSLETTISVVNASGKVIGNGDASGKSYNYRIDLLEPVKDCYLLIEPQFRDPITLPIPDIIYPTEYEMPTVILPELPGGTHYISSASDWNNLVSGKEYVSGNIIQIADIDFSGTTFTPCKMFLGGTYDGNGFEITGINVDTDLDDYGYAMFITTEHATFKNMKFSDCSIKIRSQDCVALLACFAYATDMDNISFDNCYVEGTSEVAIVASEIHSDFDFYILNTHISVIKDITVSNSTVKGNDASYAESIIVCGCYGEALLTDKLSYTINFKNIKVINCSVIAEGTSAGYSPSGGFGDVYGTKIIDSMVQADVYASHSDVEDVAWYPGGFGGSVYGSHIERCGFEGKIVTRNYDATGGFFGFACSNTYKYWENDSWEYSDDDILSVFIDCFSQADIVNEELGVQYYDGALISGFVGESYGSDSLRCYSASTINSVVATIPSPAFIGESNDDVFSNCYYDSSLLASETSQATGRTTAQMNQQATFAGWDFDEVWKIDEGNDYPRFSLMKPLTTVKSYVFIIPDESGTLDHEGVTWKTLDRSISSDVYKGKLGERVTHTYGGDSLPLEMTNEETGESEERTFYFVFSGTTDFERRGGYGFITEEKERTVELLAEHENNVAFYYAEPLESYEVMRIGTTMGVQLIKVYTDERDYPIKVQLSEGTIGRIGLVDKYADNASVVRVMTPYGVMAFELVE